MNKTEIVACIYKHVGRTDGLENLTELAEEISRMAAEEEREACAKLCEENDARWDKIGGDGGASLECAEAIRSRSNAPHEGPARASCAGPLDAVVMPGWRNGERK